jgi:hypothetical protein
MQSNRGTRRTFNIELSPVQTVRSTLALFRVEIIILVRQSVIVTILRDGRLKNRGWVPVRFEILSSAKSPDHLGGGGGAPSLLFSRYLRLFANGICGRCLKLITHLSLAMSGAIPSLRHELLYHAQGP